MQEKPKLSILIPVLNEERNILPLYNKLSAELSKLSLSYEIVFIDDGSSDNSLSAIKEINSKDPKVLCLSFSRNFGHMAALSAGMDFARGDAVITMDADLQHPVELIPKLISEWEKGAQVVNTVRTGAKGAGVFKRITAGIFYYLINKIAKINLPANAADFRLIDRQVVETFKSMKERSRFLRGMVSWVGYKQAFIPYEADKRFSGTTKYSVSRMIAFAIDGIASFSAFPLRLSTYFGLFVAFLSALYIIYAIYIKIFTNQAIQGWTSVLVAVLFMGGVQLISLGIIGEYLSRVYDEAKGRPLYIINKKIGL